VSIAAAETLQRSTVPASKRSSAKRDRVIYWTTTAIVLAVMVFSIINFTFLQGFPFSEGGFVHLHLPNYFRIELTTAKILGVLALLIPGVPAKVKEFAYFGFGITLLSASIAHYSVGDASRSILFVIDPLIFLGLLTVSYIYFNKRRDSRRLAVGENARI
jgi:DoxX-like family